MSDEECAMILYMANMVMTNNFPMIHEVISPEYVKMNMASALFKANFRRLQALNLFRNMKKEQEAKSLNEEA